MYFCCLKKICLSKAGDSQPFVFCLFFLVSSLGCGKKRKKKKKMGEEKEKESYNCLELWRIPPELGTTAFDNKKSIEEQQKDRDRAAELVAKEYEKRSEGKPFPPNSLTHQVIDSLFISICLFIFLLLISLFAQLPSF